MVGKTAGGKMCRSVHLFRGGLVCKAHGPLYHSVLGLRVIKKMKKKWGGRTRSTTQLWEMVGEVPRGEKMLCYGTDLESYITKHTSVHEEKRTAKKWGGRTRSG